MDGLEVGVDLVGPVSELGEDFGSVLADGGRRPAAADDVVVEHQRHAHGRDVVVLDERAPGLGHLAAEHLVEVVDARRWDAGSLEDLGPLEGRARAERLFDLRPESGLVLGSRPVRRVPRIVQQVGPFDRRDERDPQGLARRGDEQIGILSLERLVRRGDRVARPVTGRAPRA